MRCRVARKFGCSLQYKATPTMGSAFSRAAPRAKKAWQGHGAAFPAPPTAPRAGTSPAPEIAEHREIVETLGKSTILTSATSPQKRPKVDTVERPAGMSASNLLRALALHAQRPDRWGAAELADKFGVAMAPLASALRYCRAFRVIEDKDEGRYYGVPVKRENTLDGGGAKGRAP